MRTLKLCCLFSVLILTLGCQPQRYHHVNAGLSYFPPPHWHVDDSHIHEAHRTPEVGNFGIIYVQSAVPMDTASNLINQVEEETNTLLVAKYTVETDQGITVNRYTTKQKDSGATSLYNSVCFIPHGDELVLFTCETEALDMVRLFDRVLESVRFEDE